jgi:hypothetical protein
VPSFRLHIYWLIFILQEVRRVLPVEVNNLDEATRISLAIQVEKRNCIQAEINLAKRRCRLNTFSAHHNGLSATTLEKKLDKHSKELSASVADAIKKHKASQPHNCTQVPHPNTGRKCISFLGVGSTK